MFQQRGGPLHALSRPAHDRGRSSVKRSREHAHQSDTPSKFWTVGIPTFVVASDRAPSGDGKHITLQLFALNEQQWRPLGAFQSVEHSAVSFGKLPLSARSSHSVRCTRLRLHRARRTWCDGHWNKKCSLGRGTSAIPRAPRAPSPLAMSFARFDRSNAPRNGESHEFPTPDNRRFDSAGVFRRCSRQDVLCAARVPVPGRDDIVRNRGARSRPCSRDGPFPVRAVRGTISFTTCRKRVAQLAESSLASLRSCWSRRHGIWWRVEGSTTGDRSCADCQHRPGDRRRGTRYQRVDGASRTKQGSQGRGAGQQSR
ncbi:hypothetical protein BH160DRAFT_7238 [Burkholderia sp. H160]|nr:hypothetical protein BH160DRAFT_7238 [Burkholderia sp. H160]